MGLVDRHGTRLGPDDGKPDIVIPGIGEIDEIRRMADAAEEQVRVLREQVDFAKQQAADAKKASRFSLVIAGIALLVALADLVFKFVIPGG